MKTTTPYVLALSLSAIALAGCAGPESADAPASESAAMAAPRVPSRPTGAGELPPAIVGQGGALMGSDVHYVPGDAVSTGYLAVPAGDGPFPALVIVHEWNGLVDRVRQVADNFAAEGYVTLAVDLFDTRIGTSPEQNMALMSEALGNPAKVIANMNAAVAHLKARPDVSGRVGAMGWCFGGGVALSFGLDGANHEATAIFYGALVNDPQRLATMSHEVYGTFARLDTGPAPEQVEAFAAALQAAGIANDLHIYDDVNHGFWLRVDEEPAVRTAPALDAWERLKGYLDRTLRQGAQ